jgi:hypothetical protein
MESIPELNGNTDVVYLVTWLLVGVSSGKTASLLGIQNLSVPSDNFIPYDDLTEDQVLGWVKSAMGLAHITELETQIDRDIANQLTPILVELPLPWVA